MNQDEFETILASLASQYAEACQDEIASLRQENRAEHDVLVSKVTILANAYAAGDISGKNKEMRDLQTDAALLASGEHAAMVGLHSGLVTVRKRATAVRVGVEHEMKLWRAWLASQGGGGI